MMKERNTEQTDRKIDPTPKIAIMKMQLQQKSITIESGIIGQNPK